MNARVLRKRWCRVLAANLKRAGKLEHRSGSLNADAVHEVRVALRRARLLLQLRSKRHDHQRTKRVRSIARKLLDAYAPVRDCDVAIEWARAQQASVAVLAQLLRQRAARCRQAERQRKQHKFRAHADRLSGAGKTDANKLARRFERWLSAMATHSRAAARRARKLSTAELHALRRDIRRWRYLRELLISPRAVARDPILRKLVAAQEALGAIQNLEVVLAYLQQCGRASEVATLKCRARLSLAVNREAALQEMRRLTAKHGARG